MLIAVVAAQNLRDEPDVSDTSLPGAPAREQIARGAYLARAGNCIGCHTARGGVAYAGGRGIETPFGTVYSSNLTPDREAGIGQWTAAHFWRALHNGRSRDGRLLYPAFPYPSYTLVTRVDADDIFAYLRSLPPAAVANRPHALRFPYNSQAALAVWRALYFRTGRFESDASRSAEWNRGAYLVRGLGHCNACHASRNLLGATSDLQSLGGGLIPMRNWYAPSLSSAREASVADWDLRQIVGLLQTGISARTFVAGPMKEVVRLSTQYLSDGDLRAMALYLKMLPHSDGVAAPPTPPASAQVARGARLYGQHCVQCHGETGEGAPDVYPPLAGNRGVMLDPPANLIRIVWGGGFPPATSGNPRPYGMPPFAVVLSDAEVADVSTFIRNAWGNRGSAVSPLEVARYRGGLTD